MKKVNLSISAHRLPLFWQTLGWRSKFPYRYLIKSLPLYTKMSQYWSYIVIYSQLYISSASKISTYQYFMACLKWIGRSQYVWTIELKHSSEATWRKSSLETVSRVHEGYHIIQIFECFSAILKIWDKKAFFAQLSIVYLINLTSYFSWLYL